MLLISWFPRLYHKSRAASAADMKAASFATDFTPGADSSEPETSTTSAPDAHAARTLSAETPPARTVRHGPFRSAVSPSPC